MLLVGIKMSLIFNRTQGMNAIVYRGYIVSKIFGDPKTINLAEPVIPFRDFIWNNRLSSKPSFSHSDCYWMVL